MVSRWSAYGHLMSRLGGGSCRRLVFYFLDDRGLIKTAFQAACALQVK
jgi:hypothetical protein